MISFAADIRVFSNFVNPVSGVKVDDTDNSMSIISAVMTNGGASIILSDDSEKTLASIVSAIQAM
ncbi:hypothetical protein [Calorimonas adulescens]|uniref:Uncharacterized protein n=1 Tax=Calorimonas adulescens TaxID=2606906 RepID=A0A5D8Q7X0_9THEO|nr:hypothetical protein [Calorimonas adulescens]MDI6601334.1 hypothetical protein [Thermoanaerobacteraceae bacterium]TZE80730.1 hypothetical protein FWJ32_12300 [Calorimonas adulescens]